MKSARNCEKFCEEIWRWFSRHKRVLPWRDLNIKDDTERAYRILVSEVMLQQTQVPRVEVIFRRFLREFPTLQDLALASNKQVILAWRGMGYNSRALRLRDAARSVIETFDGHFPRAQEDLLSIKGIGPYTAAAILNFAFDIPTPCLDTNIRRILHRVFFQPERRDGTFRKSDAELLRVAEEVLIHCSVHAKPFKKLSEGAGLAGPAPGGHHKGKGGFAGGTPLGGPSAQWHAALMDFGSLVCTKRSPRCGVCPLAKAHLCRSAGMINRRDALPFGCAQGKRGRLPSPKQEPGRTIAGTFVPNRIIRGRIVEFLRDAPRGAAFDDIGAHVCIDWNTNEHEKWLKGIMTKLEKDGIVARGRGRYFLKE